MLRSLLVEQFVYQVGYWRGDRGGLRNEPLQEVFVVLDLCGRKVDDELRRHGPPVVLAGDDVPGEGFGLQSLGVALEAVRVGGLGEDAGGRREDVLAGGAGVGGLEGVGAGVQDGGRG